jgi:hypothetical protein
LIKIDQTAIGISRHKLALSMDIHYCVLRMFSEPESMQCYLIWKTVVEEKQNILLNFCQ